MSLTAEKIAFVCCSCFFLTVPTIVYTVFGIYFLVTDVNVCYTYSPLWIFGVVTFGLIVLSIPIRAGLSRIDYGKANRDYFASISPDFIVLKPEWFVWLPAWILWLIYAAIVIYGGYTCDDMKTHGLWDWALVTFWFHVAVAVFLFLVIGCRLCCHSKKNSDALSPEERVALRA